METKAQLELLREIGCDLAQGFLFSPAISAEGLAGLMNGGFDNSGYFLGADGSRNSFSPPRLVLPDRRGGGGLTAEGFGGRGRRQGTKKALSPGVVAPPG